MARFQWNQVSIFHWLKEEDVCNHQGSLLEVGTLVFVWRNLSHLSPLFPFVTFVHISHHNGMW